MNIGKLKNNIKQPCRLKESRTPIYYAPGKNKT